jgi:hypothetical protein
MIGQLIGAITNQIIGQLLAPPYALGLPIKEGGDDESP